MELFIRNLDPRVTNDELEVFLTTLLDPVAVQIFDFHKTKKKSCAILTIADVSKGQELLATYQRSPSSPCFRLLDKQVYLSESRKPPDPYLVKALRKNENDRIIWLSSNQKRRKYLSGNRSKSANLKFRELSCGRWEVHESTLQYVVFSTNACRGTIKIDRWSLTLTLEVSKLTNSSYEVVMDFYEILSIAVDPINGQTDVTVTLGVAPKIYVREKPSNLDLHDIFKALFENTGITEPTKYRCRELGATSFTVENGFDIFEEINLKSLGAGPVLQSRPLACIPAQITFDDQVSRLIHESTLYELSYGLRFQIERLWMNAILSPHKVCGLLDKIVQVRNRSGNHIAVQVVGRLSNQIPQAGPKVNPVSLSLGKLLGLISIVEESLVFNRMNNLEGMSSRSGEILIHKVMVTPTGIYLDGPHVEYSNRILRKYSRYADHFLRVTFAEEDGERLVFNRDYSNKRIFLEGFQPILRNGIDIAGRHFDFLGFSHSSLRSQTCWFMAPFHLNHELLTATIVIQRLGDFSHIRSSAKCAARIGQAFSDSHTSISIDPSFVTHLAEVKNEDYTFSDGVGTFSPKLWSLIRKQSKNLDHVEPTLYQIRYGGAKGMISLDFRLEGYKLCLRPSMIKYEGSQFSDIEICGSALRPLPMRLNRQHIKILEDLGIAVQVFERLQQKAVQNLRAGASSSQSANAFLQSSFANGKTQLPWLLKKLDELDIDATEEAFILDILSALIHIELKELKYRARIPVEKAVTLYGIMDESNVLREGQIYCTFSNRPTKCVLRGRVAVTRSPALHPGDVQVVEAVPVSNDSPLAKIHNCVVFSSQGTRDLPSQLSGGDLDGDLYNVIYDINLLPKTTMSPVDYTRAPPQDIGRQVTARDMTDFFLDFMENDQLGRIATLHQVLADQHPDGTKSSECLKLAALHSTAVDFSKTGIPVNLKEIPRTPLARPDFMAPGPNTKVEKGIPTQDLTSPDPGETTTRSYRYYESEHALGILYRSIDEEAFFEALQDDVSSVFSKGSQCSVLEQIWHCVEMTIPALSWRRYLNAAIEIRDSYDSGVVDSMLEYAFHRCNYLSETEVFIGAIVGKNGVGTKRQREQAIIMKERFGREVDEVNAWIRAGGDALERAIACLFVGKSPRRDVTHRVNVELVSFGWIVAATCLQEVEKYQARDQEEAYN